ncbi:hypothetical protein BEE12_16130 [Pantoea agglomerans]|uniref:hypothetical protein n=1 Tax=Enterobacter agglomerans TaxID=549 RepID=UPI00083D4B21|nr:hypothetical protein [Pantoea agglomerans]AOE41245.1 hypothetical protein BEE12_16130 [Pantoea agglomerans]
MTSKLVLTDSYQVATDGGKACLVIPSRKNSTDKIRYFIADATPTADDEGFPWNEPINIPAGVKAWVRGSGILYLNPYSPQ